MPSEMFGPVWGLLQEVAEGTSSPVDYAAMGFLASAASLVGARRWIRPFETSEWREPCIVWAAIVGDPSSNKTPPLLAITNPLKEMERDKADEYEQTLLDHRTICERAKAEEAAWKQNVEAAQKENIATPPLPEAAVMPVEPQRKRLMVRDITPEQLLEVLSGNPQGVLSYRDELVGWIIGFDRYSPGGRDQWLQAFNGASYSSDRKANGGRLTYAPFNGVSVLGGIQPDRLSSIMLAGDDDGLPARFLWAWPNPVRFSRPKRLANIGALETIFRRLEGLSWGIAEDGREVGITLPLDPAAADLYEKWAGENAEGTEDSGPLYRGFVGKLRGYVLRLALISELTRWAAEGRDEPRSVSAKTLGATIDFVEDYAKPAALRVFGDAALPAVERNAAMFARYILRHKVRRFNARKMVKDCKLPGFRDAGVMGDVVSFLDDADWLKAVGHREGDTPGRKTADYSVNPLVFGGSDGTVA
jgi:putative DNA primase/helicase